MVGWQVGRGELPRIRYNRVSKGDTEGGGLFLARLRWPLCSGLLSFLFALSAFGQVAGPELPGPPPPAASPQAKPQTPPAASPAPAGQQKAKPPAMEEIERAEPRKPVNPADIIQAIRVVGNRRIEAGTIESYMLLRPGEPFDEELMDRSLKALFATGLFSDVRLRRDGQTLIVEVKENPLVNRVAFEGNKELTDETLSKEVQLRQRAVYTEAAVEADRQHILEAYARNGMFAAEVTPKIVRLPDNHVDVIFDIKEGPKTYISRISFVGNHAFSQYTLRQVITSRQQVWWNFLTSADTYDPKRINYDKEELRRFYLRNGYVDFKVISANAELSPDRKSFFLTFTLQEGQRYKIGDISIESRIRKLDGNSLMGAVQLAKGDYYNGDKVENSVDAIKKAAKDQGIQFVDVKPEIKRDPAKHIVDLRFLVTQGPRVYVERIDITGNTRTQDYVIRRQFTLAEGDPLDQEALKNTRQALQDLNYFDNVNITTSPGSAPDRAIVNTQVADKATGQFSFGGGYSTDIGPLLNLGLTQRNILGSGNDAGITGVIALYETAADLNFTDPYLFDRNLVSSSDIFYSNLNNYYIAAFQERREGFSETIGYQISDHLRQAVTYQFADRQIYGVPNYASFYIQSQQFVSTLSQIGQILTLDYRDSALNPHSGYVIRVGTDYAGLGGNADFNRFTLDGQYFIPLDYFTGNKDWNISFLGSGGYLLPYGRPGPGLPYGTSYIIDRFFLGGYNLRGFLDGGVGPHDPRTGDSLGGNLMWTESTELHFPLPVPQDLGIFGRLFVDIGSLQGLTEVPGHPLYANDGSIRVGVGVGVTWNSPFGLINLDIGDPIVRKQFDQTEIFRIGFGTRF